MRERFLKLIADIHDASLDPAMWDGVLRDTAALVGGHIANQQRLDPATMAVSIERQYGIDPEIGRLYAECHAANDPWVHTMAPLYGPGQGSTGAANLPFSELQQTAVYNEIYKLIDVSDCAAVMVEKSASKWRYVTVNRSVSRGFFSASELQRLQKLFPHFRSALTVSDRLSGVEADLRAREAALHALAVPLFLLARNGRVLFANEAAQTLISGAAPFACFHGELVLEDCAARASLASALAQPFAVLSFAVNRCGSLLPWIVHVTPVTSDSTRSVLPRADDAVLLLSVADLHCEQERAASSLAAIFGFTAAEAKVACDLARAVSIEEIVAATGRSRETVRTHVKSLLAKTGTTRQQELVVVLLRALSPFSAR